jgi:hypothetical protein
MVRERLALLSALTALSTSGCSRGENASARAVASTDGAAFSMPIAAKPFYRLDAAPPSPCAVGATCEVKLRLTSLGTYKVNEEYPFKFIAASSSPSLHVEGQGTFTHEAKQLGTMLLHFRGEAPGPAKLSGVFKLSVCNEATCEIEEPELSLDVQVL